MNRRSFLHSILAAPLAAAASKPNVVVMLADDLGWADVGYHGGEIETPNIDRLASEGTRLERHYSFPVCSPTRSALLTGRSPMRLGLGETVIRPWSDYGLPLQEHTIANSFQSAGYETAISGKWHLGHGSRRYFPSARGFQHSYGHFNGAIDYYTHDRDGGLDWHRNGKSLSEEGYSTDLIAAEAVSRIRSRDKSKSLFLYVPFNAPHSPLQAPPELIRKYSRIPDKQRRVFAAMVDRMDVGVGRILDELKQQGIAGDTIVLFTSDNGGPTNLGARNTPLRGAKATTFEGGIRVPAVVRWANQIKAGATLSQVSTAMDLFPTLAAAAGIKPGNQLPLDGRNLWPVWTGGQRPFTREDLFFSVSQGKNYAAVHSAPWKLVIEGETKMLFNIDEDPNEQKDLAAEHPGRVKDLAARIDKWRQTAPANRERFSNKAPSGFKAPAKWADGAHN